MKLASLRKDQKIQLENIGDAEPSAEQQSELEYYHREISYLEEKAQGLYNYQLEKEAELNEVAQQARNELLLEQAKQTALEELRQQDQDKLQQDLSNDLER